MKKLILLFTGLLGITLILTGCNNSSDEDSAPSAKTILAKNKKNQGSITSLKMVENNVYKDQDLGSVTKTKSTMFYSKHNDQRIMHTKLIIDGKDSLENWLTNDTGYLKKDGKWYKADMSDNTPNAQAELMNDKAYTNTSLIPSDLIDFCDSSDEGDTYVVTYDTDDKDEVEEFKDKYLKTMADTPRKRQSQNSEFKKIKIKEVFDKKTYRLISLVFTIKGTTKTNGFILDFTNKLTTSKYNEYNDLQLPDDVSDASDMPRAMLDDTRSEDMNR